MKTKLFSFLLVLAASIGTAVASYTQVGGIWYNFNGVTAEVTYRGANYDSYTNEYSGVVSIPASVTYNGQTYSVTSIGESAFEGCNGLISVTIPNSITSFGDYSFGDCSGLTSITIPSSVTSIGWAAFYGCSFASIEIPNTITSIGDGAFYDCDFTSIDIPNSVTRIGEFAFSDCSSLASIYIPNSVTSIGEGAFYNCSGLTSVTIPNSVISIGEGAFYNCSGLTSVTIPNSVISIKHGTFYNCSGLASIDIPNSVTRIGDEAFYNCIGLPSVTIPNSVTTIGANAFYNVESIEYCGSATGAPWGAKTKAPSIINYIMVDDLYYDINRCEQIATVRYKSKERIDTTVISGYAIKQYVAFWQYNYGWVVTEANIPDSIKVLDKSYSVTAIDEFAFYIASFAGSIGMQSVSIPKGVTSIGGGAFAGCTDLTSVTCHAIVPPSMGVASWQYKYWRWENGNFNYNDHDDLSYTKQLGVFGEVDCSQIPLYVPRASVEAYRAADQWKDFIVKPIEDNFAISFQNWDGTELLSLDVKEDSIPVYTGATPTRPEDDEFVYTFSGWTPEIVAATHNTIYTATYTTTRKSYVITWQNDDSSIIDQTIVEYGKIPTHAEPSKEATAEWTYTFAGWRPKIAAVTGEASYKATFDSIINVYEVLTAAENGVVTGGGKYAYGTSVTLSANPNYGYHFKQWTDGNTETPRTIVVTQDITYTAEFALNQYSINVSCDETYGHIEGENGNFNYQTTHEYLAIANYGYHFTQWSDGNIQNPRTIILTQDTILTAEFSKDFYTITDNSNPEQGHIEGIGSYDYLSELQINAIPNYGYYFTQWSDGNTDNPRTVVVTRDITYTAEFAIDKSGTCGETNALTWSYDDQSKTLTITGNGALTENYTYGVEAPTEMNTLIIGDGVTAIGDNAFYGMTSIYHLFIGANVASIGNYAFAECRNFDDITCYATIVPTINATTFANVGNKQYIYLYVPADRERAYKRDTYWGEFDVQIKSATTTTADDVTVTPTETTAEVTWPVVENATTYELTIKDGNGNVICTLVFNAQGQLTSIAFAAPSRAQQSTQSAGFSFTVTGLDSGSHYSFTIDAKDDSGEVIDTKSGSFETTSEMITAIDNLTTIAAPVKIFRNGQPFILRDGKTYTIQGQEVK